MAKMLILIIHHSYILKSCSKLIIIRMSEFFKDKPPALARGTSRALGSGRKASFFVSFRFGVNSDVKSSNGVL